MYASTFFMRSCKIWHGIPPCGSGFLLALTIWNRVWVSFAAVYYVISGVSVTDIAGVVGQQNISRSGQKII